MSSLNESQFLKQFSSSSFSSQIIPTELSISQTENNLNSNAVTKYYLLFMRGKTIWKLTKRGDLALPYLQDANTLISKGINNSNEKIDKKLKALIIFYIHKIRFFVSLNILWSWHTRSFTSTLPSNHHHHQQQQKQQEQKQQEQFEKLIKILSLLNVEEKKEENTQGNDQIQNKKCFNDGNDKNIDNEVELVSSLYPKSSLPTPITTTTTITPTNILESSTIADICSSCGCPKLLNSSQQYEQCIKFFGFEEENIFPISFSSVSNHIPNLENIIKDSIIGIISCRIWDSYDFQSSYFLSRISYHITLLKSNSQFLWISPLFATSLIQNTFESSLNEIYKLFEKKKTQIVSMWSHENTIHRLHQIFERFYVFESTREQVNYF